MAEQLFDDHTEQLTRLAWALRPKILALIVLALSCFGAAAAMTYVVGKPKLDQATNAALEAEAKGIASALDANARAAYKRAVDIATTPMVRAAILTDAATVADMARSEFQFKPINGESFELYQVDDTKTTFLIRMPGDAPQIGQIGEHEKKLENTNNGNINILVGVPIARLKEGSGYKDTVTGMLTLSFIVDLTFVKQQLGHYAVYAALEGVGNPLVLVDQGYKVHHTVELPIKLDNEWTQGPVILRVAPAMTNHRPKWVNPVKIASASFGALLLLGLAIALAKHRTASPQFVSRRPR